MVECNDCHVKILNRADSRILLCYSCWNHLQSLADIGEDIMKYYPDWDKIKEMVEKDIQFSAKWNNTLKHTGLIK